MSKFYSIYPNQNFFEQSAKIVLEKCYNNNNKLAFAKNQIWVPSARIAQGLKDELTKQLGNYAILPQIKTISFDDSDSQTLQFYNAEQDFLSQEFLAPASKLLYFAKAITLAMPDWTFNQAFAEAPSLVKLHQDLQNYDISLEQLYEAVPFELSSHWEKNLYIVRAVFKFYNEFLEQNNKQDKYQFQNKLIELYIQQYYSNPSIAEYVFAIGFNDTTQLGKKILKQITNLDNGCFVFPYINQEYFKVEKLDSTNSQYAIHSLAKFLDINPYNLKYIGEKSTNIEFVDNVFLPYEQTYKWANEKIDYDFKNLNIITADEILQEAKSIALIMREALETKDKTCALISPNRALAQHVIQELKKWNVDVNDSAGTPLNNTIKGQFSLNLIDMIINDFTIENIIPVVTSQAINKKFKFDYHKSKDAFLELGIISTNIDSSIESLENKIKQNLPWQNKSRIKDETITNALNILNMLKQSTVNLNVTSNKNLAVWATIHLDTLLEYINPEDLFDNDEGKALAEVFVQLKQTELISEVDLKTYFQTFKLLLEQTVVRQTTNLHPRLFIWGAPEARLQKIDRIIIADFNDATWPGKIKSSLWLNPSIRSQLNMPDISVSAGLNANDLYNQLLAKEVYITRSKKDEQGETIPSRFLTRLDNALTEQNKLIAYANGQYYLDILDKITSTKVKEYLNVPKYKAKLTMLDGQKLPAEISASSIKNLANCPYKFFLNKIIYVQELEDVKEIAPNIWGTVVHLMLEVFLAGEKYGLTKLNLPLKKDKKDEYIQRFNLIIESVLSQINSNIIDLSWRNKLNKISEEFLEISLKNNSSEIFTEQEYKYGNLKAIYDRVEFTPDGANIIDYKTGTPPTKKDMISFKDPQLLVESYILEKNNKPVNSLNYWQIKGYGAKPIDIQNVSGKDEDFNDIKQSAYETIENLIEHFKIDGTSFYPQVNGTIKQKKGACQYCPYAGICRGFKL
jgi:ATP-dependent helicase/nuclease subunit B